MATTTVTATHQTTNDNDNLLDDNYYRNETEAILQDLTLAMESPEHSNIAVRMMRAKRVFDLMTHQAVSYEEASFRGFTTAPDFDGKLHFYNRFVEVTKDIARKKLAEKLPAGEKEDGDDAEDEEEEEFQKVKSIQLRTGAAIDAVIFFFADGTQKQYGASGGTAGKVFDLQKGEYITKIEYRSDCSCNGYRGGGFQLTTNKGVKHGWIASGYSSYTHTYEAKPGQQIVDIKWDTTTNNATRGRVNGVEYADVEVAKKKKNSKKKQSDEEKKEAEKRFNNRLHDLKALHDLHGEMKRLTTETTVTLQYAGLHLQLNGQAVDTRQELFDSFRTAWTKELEKRAIRALLAGLEFHRGNPIHTLVLEQCFSCLQLCFWLTVKEQRQYKIHHIQSKYRIALTDSLEKNVKFNNVQEYIPLVSHILEGELKRCAFLFEDTNFVNETKLLMQNALIGGRASKMISDPEFGVIAVLGYPNLREEEFKVLYNVFEFSQDCVSQMHAALANSVKTAGTLLLSHGLNIPTVMELRASYSKLLANAIPQQQALDFHLALQDGIREFLPTDGSFEEALAAMIDKLIRPRPRDHQPIIDAFESLALSSNSEAFFAHYKRALSLRLLGLKGSPNFALEKFAVDQLTISRGVAFTRHFTTMIEECCQEDSKVPILCNALAWPQHFDSFPSEVQRRPHFPAEVQKHFDVFVESQHQAKKHWHVWVEPSLCTVEVNYQPVPSGPTCTILGTADQINVLCCFEGGARQNITCSSSSASSNHNTTPSSPSATDQNISPTFLSLDEISQHLHYDMHLLSYILPTLVGSKLLCVNPSKKHSYTLNLKFLEEGGGKKIVLPTLGAHKRGGVRGATTPSTPLT